MLVRRKAEIDYFKTPFTKLGAVSYDFLKYNVKCSVSDVIICFPCNSESPTKCDFIEISTHEN